MNPAVAFTLILLSLMIGGGVVSASWGYTIGRQALTGVRQPESRPTSGTPNTRGTVTGGHGATVLMDENEIIQEVKSRMQGSEKPSSN
ncbi:MAG TPA: hypothetical protein V6D29_24400 [Leptolyngbyaceae cyanobacterium]